ncbi:MAG: tyrosine-type recombinase/integrase [Actinomycetaceae bacterium]|nr:tyrosine-type recombinase/integrase [Actinomycetaceae bacterium]
MRHRLFGSIEHKTSGRYRASFPNPAYGEPGEPKRINRMFTRKGEADTWLAKQQALIEAEKWRSPLQAAHAARKQAAAQLTFGEYFEHYMQTTSLRPSSRHSYESHYKNHLKPKWENVPLHDITREAVTTWVHTQLSPDHPAARKHAFETFRIIMNRAVEDGLIPYAPVTRSEAAFVGSGARNNPRKQTHLLIEPSHLTGLITAAPSPYNLLFELMGVYGLRPGEALELRRMDVDFKDGSISIRRNVQFVDGNVAVGEPKTQAGARTVFPAVSFMVKLKAHADRLPEDAGQLLFPRPYDSAQHVTLGMLQHHVQNLSRKLGYPAYRPYDFRHTAITNAMHIPGVDPHDVQEMVGHSNVAMTEYYMVRSAGRLRRLGETIGNARQTEE